MSRVKVRYRGFRIWPFLRLHPIRIGRTRLYTLGPIALFVGDEPAICRGVGRRG